MNAQSRYPSIPHRRAMVPGRPRQLSTSVDRYIHEAILPELDGEVVAIITPHAGHMYSGPVAGYAFADLAGV